MSGGGGGGGGSDAVDYQRQQEQERQARIRSGMSRIDEIFNGKDVVTGYTGQLNPNKAGIGNGTYYGPGGEVFNIQNGNSGNVRWAGTAAPGVGPQAARLQIRSDRNWLDAPDVLYTGKGGTGTAINPSVGGIGNGRYYDATGRMYELANGNQGNLRWTGTAGPGVGPEAARVQYNNGGTWQNLPDQLYTGATMEHQGGFDDSFYNKRATAYNEFALPQLQDQYEDQRKALTYALARGGNLGSSLSAAKKAALDKDYALQQQNVYDTGQDYANKARADVAAQKQNMVSLLQASADPDAVANLAQSQAQSLSSMPSFSPLSPVISNVAGSLGTYLANQQTADAVRKAYGNSPYSNPLSRSSGKVG